jgi:hypothetical protein
MFSQHMYVLNIHSAHSPFFSLQNAACFIIIPFLVHVLFTFYIQDVLKFKNKFGRLRANHEFKSWIHGPCMGIFP